MIVEIWMLVAALAVPMLTIVGAAIPALVSWGRMTERLSRLEKDCDSKASKESHDGIAKDLAELKSDLKSGLHRLERIVRGDTSPGD